MRTQHNRALTALELYVAATGQPLSFYARKLAERGATPKQIANSATTLRKHLRQGGATFGYAKRVARLLGIVETPLHDLLLKPRTSWPKWAVTGEAANTIQGARTPQGTTGTPRNHALRESAKRGARPVGATGENCGLPRRDASQHTAPYLELLP